MWRAVRAPPLQLCEQGCCRLAQAVRQAGIIGHQHLHYGVVPGLGKCNAPQAGVSVRSVRRTRAAHRTRRGNCHSECFLEPATCTRGLPAVKAL